MAEENAAARAARVVLAKVEPEHAGSRISPSGPERSGKQAGRCSALGPVALADLQHCADASVPSLHPARVFSYVRYRSC